MSGQTTPSPTEDKAELEPKLESKLSPNGRYYSSLHPCTALPNGWKREVRHYSHSSKSIRGNYKTTAYVLKGERYETKNALADAFSKITKNENGVDLSSFDWKNGRWIRQHHKQKKGLEQLSTELFGKGITDINFTISQPNEMLKRSLPATGKLKPLVKAVTTKTDCSTKYHCARKDIVEYDFDYTRSEGINGTPIEQPLKKRARQANDMSLYGPVQVFGMKRLQGVNMVPVLSDLKAGDKDSGSKVVKIEQPQLPPGMDEKVIGVDQDIEKRLVIKMDKTEVTIDNPDLIEHDFKNLLTSDILWKQAMLSLTLDGKPLPSSAIWGQNKEELLRISKNPDCFVNALQPFVKSFTISKEIIAEQAKRVRKLRNELAAVQNDLIGLEKEELKMCSEDVSDVKIFGIKKEEKVEIPSSNGVSDEVTIIE